MILPSAAKTKGDLLPAPPPGTAAKTGNWWLVAFVAAKSAAAKMFAAAAKPNSNQIVYGDYLELGTQHLEL